MGLAGAKAVTFRPLLTRRSPLVPRKACRLWGCAAERNEKPVSYPTLSPRASSLSPRFGRGPPCARCPLPHQPDFGASPNTNSTSWLPRPQSSDPSDRDSTSAVPLRTARNPSVAQMSALSMSTVASRGASAPARRPTSACGVPLANSRSFFSGSGESPACHVEGWAAGASFRGICARVSLQILSGAVDSAE